MKAHLQRLTAAAREKLRSFDVEALRRSGLFPLDGQYFPAIFYPPIPFVPPSTEQELFPRLSPDDRPPPALYVHIPFCPSRCLYCHWAVSVGDSEAEMEAYLDAMGREIDLFKARTGRDVIQPRSLLLGGGTPTMLSVRLTEKLFSMLHSQFDMSRCAQIVCEAEPTTVLGADGFDKLRALHANNVERVSFGVQTFDDDAARGMGRLHTAADAVRAVEVARRAGIRTVSLDLIYGYPGCTLEAWAETLEAALALDVDACQLYRLRVVPHGDKIGAIRTLYDQHPSQFPTYSDVHLMKEFGILYCHEKGWAEVSRRVFSRHATRTNSEYLRDHTDRLADVLGVGISAWSVIHGHLSINTGESLARYYSYLQAGALPIDRGRVRGVDDIRRWAIALPLKHNGVSKSYYRSFTGVTPEEVFPDKLARLRQHDLVCDTDDRLALTERGRFFADEVVIQFYHPEFLPFPRDAYSDGELNPHNG